MYLKSILCISFAAVTLTLGNQSQDGVQPNGDASYEFGYDIHNPLSNDIKSHHEIRDGKNVLGFYTFKEADGTIRIVKYKVTPDSGFEAVVEKLNPDPINGNAIDGQETAQSTHGAPQTILEPRGGHNSPYVAGIKQPSGNHNSRGNPQTNQDSNPYIIRRNSRFGNNQQSQLPVVYNRARNHHDHDGGEETRYIDIPRGRQRNQRQRNGELQIQEAAEQHRHRFAPNGWANKPEQPTGPIVYIDGVPYIDDIGYTEQLRQGKIPNNDQIYVPGLTYLDNQHVVQRNAEDNTKNEEATKAADSGDEQRKAVHEEDDDEDENAEYEEDDEFLEDDDDEAEAAEFYEDDEKLIIEQKKEYDALKRAYLEEGKEEPKAKEEVTEEQQTQAATEVQQPEE